MMRPTVKIKGLLFWLAFLAIQARADLLVTCEQAKISAHDAVVKLDLRNTFKQNVESARAVVFVRDPQGKVVGHGTRLKWRSTKAS